MTGAANPLKKWISECSFWKPCNAVPSDRQVTFLVPKIGTQNETLDSDIEEGCWKEGFVEGNFFWKYPFKTVLFTLKLDFNDYDPTNFRVSFWWKLLKIMVKFDAIPLILTLEDAFAIPGARSYPQLSGQQDWITTFISTSAINITILNIAIIFPITIIITNKPFSCLYLIIPSASRR